MAITIAKELQITLQMALSEAKGRRHEFLTLEHLLLAMTRDPIAGSILRGCGANPQVLERELEAFLAQSMEALPRGKAADPEQTITFQRVLQRAAWHVQGSGRSEL